MTGEALVTPKLITWARARAGLTLEEAAKKLGIRSARLQAWEHGEDRPNFRQVDNIAHKLNIPFGYLYLSEPPVEDLPLPDFRTIAGAPPLKPSPEFLDVLDDALRKQQWCHEHLASQEYEPIKFIGKFSPDSSIDEVAADIRDTLGIDNDLRERVRSWEQFLTELIRSAESQGVLVLRSSVVGSNTHRKLNVSEFRGFTITDPLAPLIFINSRDAKAAQTFTLVHELAHLWTGQSGVSNPDYTSRSNAQRNEIERHADRVAAETLVPKNDFLIGWNDSFSLDRNLNRLASKYKVSAFVILRSAFDNQKIGQDAYLNKFRELLSNQRSAKDKGGNFYANIGARNSPTFTVAVVAAAAEGSLSYREAASLLNVVSLSTFYKIEAQLLQDE